MNRLCSTTGAMILTTLVSSLALAKVETWRHDGPAGFAKGHRDGVILADSGRIRLAQAIKPTAKLEAARVWDLARTAQGALLAATGNDGKVFRREGVGGEWTVAYDAADSQALSLVVTPDGRIYAGTGPSGQVVEVSRPDHPGSRPGPEVQYVWDLATDPKGNLYAATGPAGQLWKRSPEGPWSLLLDSKHKHLLCVVVAPDGSVYAGSDGEGLIYRVAPDGKVSVVYDAPQSEVRCLSVAPDGSIFAGTAAEANGAGGSGRSTLSMSKEKPRPGRFDSPTPVSENVKVARDHGDFTLSEDSSGFLRMVSARVANSPAPGENSVYHIAPNGVSREVFRAKALIHALALREDRLYVGTGPDGQLFEVRDLGRESSPIARIDHGQILALLDDPKLGLLIGAGDPGAVLRLEPGHVGQGSLTSEVLDARLISRFGSLTWKAEQPGGTSIKVKVRTGNVGEPDTTWSPWSTEQTDTATASASVPPGRFAQYQVTLATTDPAATPELRSISLRYQTANLPPEIAKVEIPDIATFDGATRQSKLTLRWDASDPNNDDLSYSLQIRKDGWPDWIKLGEDSLTDSSYSWDTTSVPGGTYRVRVNATDRPSNSPAEALTRDRISDPFLVDHQPPGVTVTAKAGGASVAIKDDLTRIVKAAYALDGGLWVPIFPDDTLFDTLAETITIALPDLKAGTHVLMVRATDAAGNVGTGDLVLGKP